MAAMASWQRKRARRFLMKTSRTGAFVSLLSLKERVRTIEKF